MIGQKWGDKPSSHVTVGVNDDLAERGLELLRTEYAQDCGERRTV